jgi:hypothetical protein
VLSKEIHKRWREGTRPAEPNKNCEDAAAQLDLRVTCYYKEGHGTYHDVWCGDRLLMGGCHAASVMRFLEGVAYGRGIKLNK